MENLDKNTVDVVKTEAPVMPVPQFTFEDKKPQPSKPVEEVSKTGELVEQVLHAGIAHKVQTDDTVKERVLETADKVIKTHLDVEKNKADRADKRAFFEANEAACSYFGYDEQTTNKSHVGLMRAWSWFFNTLYIVTIGFFLVAPIVFFATKLRVVVKKNWLIFVLATLIYLAVAFSPVLVAWLGRL